MNNKEFIVWCAGFFDGEGSVGITQSNTKSKQKQYALRITVTQNIKEVLDRIQKVFGGSVYDKGLKSTNSKRPVYALDFRSNGAAAFLKAVYPFLIVKRKQAELALGFQKSIQDKKKLHRRELTDEERQNRLNFKFQIEATNRSKIWIA